MANCKTCKHWKNKQATLSYWEHFGFCINPKFNFNTNDGRLIGVIDLQNLKDRLKVSGNCSHDFETGSEGQIHASRYILTTEEEFGCNFHEPEKTKK